ncbi:MAG: DoxX family protein [Flavobacteriales bacterium]
MNVLLTICRILVGSLFIVSGLIKVNDVIGFGYKLEEYFAESALNFPAMVPYVVPIAIFIVVGEVLLGVALLLGAWPKLTTGLILFMTVFFLWLTNYTASCIEAREAFKPTAEITEFTATCVETCGCFGDAIPLKPRQSFWKDVILLLFVIPVTIGAWMKKFKLNTWKEDLVIIIPSTLMVAAFSIKMLEWNFPIWFTIGANGIALLVKKLTNGKQWMMAVAVLAVCSYLQCYTYQHLPLKDYRAYAIGNDLKAKMKTSQDLLNESGLAVFVEEKVMPLLGDTINFTVNTSKPEAVAMLVKFIDENKTVVPALDALKQEIAANKTNWEQQITAAQPPKTLNIYTMKNSVSGEIKVMDSDEYLLQKIWQDTTWVINKDLTYKKQVSEGYESKIKDFDPTTQEGESMKEALMTEPRMFWFVSKNLATAEEEYMAAISAFSKAAQADGARFYGLSPSSGEEVEQYRFQHQLPFDFLIADGIELKIIIRANPGIVYIENGVVVNMWADNDLPDYSAAKQNNFRP